MYINPFQRQLLVADLTANAIATGENCDDKISG